jgi:ABC-type transport system substrate-binding protein
VLLTEALVGGRAASTPPATRAKFDYDAPIEGLRALDRYSLQLRLNQPSYPIIQQYLTDTLAVAREVVEAARRDIDTRAVGTGPYRLKEWKRGSRIVLEANPNYRVLRFPASNDPGHAAIVRPMEGKRLPQIGVVDISIIPEMQSRLLAFGAEDISTTSRCRATSPTGCWPTVGSRANTRPLASGITRCRRPMRATRISTWTDPVVGALAGTCQPSPGHGATGINADELIRVAYAGQADPAGADRTAHGHRTTRDCREDGL